MLWVLIFYIYRVECQEENNIITHIQCSIIHIQCVYLHQMVLTMHI